MEEIIKKWEDELSKDKRKDVYYTRELLNEMISDFKKQVKLFSLPEGCIKMIKTSECLPEAYPINEECAEYYAVKVEGINIPLMAMYLKNEKGECNWYTSYCSMIIKPVIQWINFKF